MCSTMYRQMLDFPSISASRALIASRSRQFCRRKVFWGKLKTISNHWTHVYFQWEKFSTLKLITACLLVVCPSRWVYVTTHTAIVSPPFNSFSHIAFNFQNTQMEFLLLLLCVEPPAEFIIPLMEILRNFFQLFSPRGKDGEWKLLVTNAVAWRMRSLFTPKNDLDARCDCNFPTETWKEREKSYFFENWEERVLIGEHERRECKRRCRCDTYS